MKLFNYAELEVSALNVDIVNLLTAIHEYRGKQELYLESKPDVLEKLQDLALIQSTDASNKIEGIFTSDKRLRELVKNKTKPHSKNEKEITGYRDVLKMIHESYQYITISSNHILQLHKELYSYLPESRSGNWKQSDNVITEKDSNGEEFVRFQPASAFQTPQLIEELIEQYTMEMEKGNIDPLILIPCFILDFLSIHPFRDGNGQMSRLLTLLLLYQNNYLVGRFISIEMLIERTKTTYYEALHDSSIGWLENKQDYLPFLQYILGIILKAYREFETRFKITHNITISSSDRILEIITHSLTPLSKADIVILAPELSQKTIERRLTDLVKSERIQKIGAGRSTAYISKS
ncbi:Fic family protein [Enterococcus sp.]|uniref:Fic family protein n=1 Tax=Enterococcus sp. TaxID=35783 RepID=UPI00290C9FAA|nr:Fic family protein [Enterococcus sp.]MDU5336583.1 Fic family protein [Enterococcus sp.]